MSNLSIMPEKNDYKQRLIEWSVAHPGQLWADTPESAAARKWMQINAADDFRSLYWNEDEKTRSGIDRRFLPKGVEQEVYNENIREGMNQAAPYVAGALAGSAGLAAGLGALPMVPQTGSGLMRAGNAVARGIDFMGKAAMPSAVLSGSAVAPYADAAALSYWSAKGLQAANEMRKNGRWGSAAALGAVSSMPLLMPLGMKGMRMYNIAKNARVTPQEVLAEPFAESVVSQPVIQSKMVEVPAPYEIGDLGGGYMLKSLMRGNPLEKQLGKNGTVSVNNVRSLVGKGSKVEQAVVDKVLASEEFAGKKAIDYNKFRKAVQDELITYERESAPGLVYEDYGMDRLGFNVIEDPAGGSIPGVLEDGVTPRVLLFDSPRIPNGSAKHYFPNTLGHSRTYTTADEPDVLHVMESQSDWAQSKAPIIGSATSVSRGVNGNTDIVLDANGIYRRVGVGEGMPESEFFHTIGDDGLTHYSRFVTQSRNEFPLEQANYLADNYTSKQIQENLRYAAEKGQTKMRYPTRETAAKIEGYPEQINYYDKNGFKVNEPYEYPENVAKRIESIQNEIDKIDLDDLDTFAPFEIVEGSFAWGSNSGEVTNAKLLAKLRDRILRDRDSLNQMQRYGDDTNTVAKRLDDREKLFDKQVAKYKEKYGHEPELDVYSSKSREAQARRAILQPELKELLGSGPMQLKKGLIEKKEYTYEDILRKYTEFPKQFKKLYKNADVRIVTDAKGNTWYEVDVPEDYLKQEWQYAAGGALNDKSEGFRPFDAGGFIQKYGADKVAAALYKDGGRIHIRPENKGKFTALLKRTGKSASWFKEHGTPLQKKRATFALNARKWKHGDGGNLHGDGDETQKPPYVNVPDNMMSIDDGVQFVMDYYNSPGYVERSRRAGLPAVPLLINPEKVNDYTKYVNESFTHGDTLTFGAIPDQYMFPVVKHPLTGKPMLSREILDYNTAISGSYPGIVGAHEAAHLNRLYNYPYTDKKNPYAKAYDSPYYNFDYSGVPPWFRTLLTPNKPVGDHGKELNENYSDLMGLRYFMQKNNIFDSMDDKKTFTEEDYDRLVDTEGAEALRYLNTHSKESVIKAINDVASTGKRKKNPNRS